MGPVIHLAWHYREYERPPQSFAVVQGVDGSYILRRSRSNLKVFSRFTHASIATISPFCDREIRPRRAQFMIGPLGTSWMAHENKARLAVLPEDIVPLDSPAIASAMYPSSYLDTTTLTLPLNGF